jgi:hypothetical protein
MRQAGVDEMMHVCEALEPGERSKNGMRFLLLALAQQALPAMQQRSNDQGE